jgi:hypothetical protein
VYAQCLYKVVAFLPFSSSFNFPIDLLGNLRNLGLWQLYGKIEVTIQPARYQSVTGASHGLVTSGVKNEKH